MLAQLPFQHSTFWHIYLQHRLQSQVLIAAEGPVVSDCSEILCAHILLRTKSDLCRHCSTGLSGDVSLSCLKGCFFSFKQAFPLRLHYNRLTGRLQELDGFLLPIGSNSLCYGATDTERERALSWLAQERFLPFQRLSTGSVCIFLHNALHYFLPFR